jgi:hypothetical protein
MDCFLLLHKKISEINIQREDYMTTFAEYRDALLNTPLIQNLEEFQRLELEQLFYLMDVSDFEKYIAILR